MKFIKSCSSWSEEIEEAIITALGQTRVLSDQEISECYEEYTPREYHRSTHDGAGLMQYVREWWTDNELAYTEAQQRITAEVAHSADPDALVAKYLSASKSEPGNALAAFSCATAACEAMDNARTVKVVNALYADGNGCLAAASFPPCYESARIRFLCDAMAKPDNPDLLCLGQRLGSAHGDDAEVLSNLGRCYFNAVGTRRLVY